MSDTSFIRDRMQGGANGSSPQLCDSAATRSRFDCLITCPSKEERAMAKAYAGCARLQRQTSRSLRRISEPSMPTAKASSRIRPRRPSGIARRRNTVIPWDRRRTGQPHSTGWAYPRTPWKGTCTKLAAEQGLAKAVSNLAEMSGALTEEERKDAERRVARFHPKEHKEWDPNFSGNRGNRASTNVRRAGQARAFGAAARAAGGY